jgi:hypothetical protein
MLSVAGERAACIYTQREYHSAYRHNGYIDRAAGLGVRAPGRLPKRTVVRHAVPKAASHLTIYRNDTVQYSTLV